MKESPVVKEFIDIFYLKEKKKLTELQRHVLVFFFFSPEYPLTEGKDDFFFLVVLQESIYDQIFKLCPSRKWSCRFNTFEAGLGVAEAAYQQALAYAKDRAQGRTPDGSGTILGHADVRRMLLRMKTLVEAVRAICLDCAVSLDMARAAEGDEAKAWAARAGFLTPIAKAFGTDVGNEVAYLGVQVHGGMGFIEEAGAAQFSRDVRVTSIYEGTNGIQAMDLVGRKLMDDGEAARALLGQIAEEAGAASGEAGMGELASDLAAAGEALHNVTKWMLTAGDVNERFAGSVDYLRAWALTLGGAYLLRGARLAEGAEKTRRTALARYYFGRELPAMHAHAKAAMAGAEPLYALDADQLAAS